MSITPVQNSLFNVEWSKSSVNGVKNKFHKSDFPDFVKKSGGNEDLSFTGLIKEGLSAASNLQKDAKQASISFETGDEPSLVNVMVARQKSSIAFEAVLQTRNKLLSAYKEIMSMPV